MEIVHSEEKKIEKNEQMSIDDDKKGQNVSAENSLMKKVKTKNEFEGGQTKKNRKSSKKNYTQRVKERVGEYYEEKPFKIHAKKRDNNSEISNVIKKNNENVTAKKPTKAQAMRVESNKAKTTIIHPRKRKKLCEQKMADSNNSKLLL